jgi:ribose transport system ATP-binding protein
MSAAVLELQRITKRYPGVVALDGVDFTVYENEILGLVGENGAGKSTLMKILIGLIQPDQGTYRLRGAPVVIKNSAHAANLGVGMVFQEGCLVPNLSIMENLFLCHEIGFRHFGFLSKRKMRDAAHAALGTVKVAADLDTPVSETTPAVRQMIEIARLLWLSKLYQQRNPVLILDEPTTVLTDDERNTLFSIATELKSQASIILISHRLQEIVETSDRILIMKDGKRVANIETRHAGIPQIEQMNVGHAFAADRFREDEQISPVDQETLTLENVRKRGVYEPLNYEDKHAEIIR